MQCSGSFFCCGPPLPLDPIHRHRIRQCRCTDQWITDRGTAQNGVLVERPSTSSTSKAAHSSTYPDKGTHFAMDGYGIRNGSAASGSGSCSRSRSRSGVAFLALPSDADDTLSGTQYNENTITTGRTKARARARSVGSDKRAYNDDEERHHWTNGDEAGAASRTPRGDAATPDFTIGQVRNSPLTASRLRSDLPQTLSRHSSYVDKCGQESASTTHEPLSSTSSSARPRLSSHIKSLLQSFSSSTPRNDADVARGNGDAKARSSSEYEHIGGPSSASRFQGLTASAQSLSGDPSTYSARSVPASSTARSKRATLPKILAMPAARIAAPNGLVGFNDDSPPLTPSSNEQAEDAVNRIRSNGAQRWHPQNEVALGGWPTHEIDNGSVSTPFSTSTTTSSGRMSPILSAFSSDSLSPSSRPSSITSFQPRKNFFSGDGILPSHVSSPSTSPDPFVQRDRAWHPQESVVSWGTGSSLASSFSGHFSHFTKTASMPSLRQYFPSMLFFLTAFVGSTTCVILALSTLPLRLPSHITELTLTEIRDMSMSLRTYSHSSTRAFAHTLAVLGCFFTWKQSFTIPGSLIMNVVFGAMYGTVFGTLYTSILTAVGGVFCYLLLAPLGPLISALPGLNKGMAKISNALGRGVATRKRPTRSLSAPVSHPASSTMSPQRRSSIHRKRAERSAGSSGNGNLWSYLLVLRLLPVVPYGLMNIACSVLRVPLLPYGVTLAIGSIPWNACTVQIGDLLVEVVSVLDDSIGPEFGGAGSSVHTSVAGQVGAAGFVNAPRPWLDDQVTSGKAALRGNTQSGIQAIASKVWTREMMFKLLLMSIVSLAPMLIQRVIQARQASSPTDEVDGVEDDDAELGCEDEEEIDAVPGSNQHLWESRRMPADNDALERGSDGIFSDGAQAFCADRERYCGSSFSHDRAPASLPRPLNASHSRAGSLRQSLTGLGPGRHPRIKRAIAKVFM